MPPNFEIASWATIEGVPVELALAVADQETARVPADKRDVVVSQGNYGRFQINCTTWRRSLKLKHCRQLLDSHTNIRVGVRILALCIDHCSDRAAECYNAGHIGTTPGANYQARVDARIRRMHASENRW